MLKAGGVMDQPLRWFAVQRAKFIGYILDECRKPDFQASKTGWGDAEYAMYEEISDVRKELKRNG